MNTKALSNRTNSKKIIFNKHKNVVPELIPIHGKQPIKNSFAKKIPKPTTTTEEIPEIVFSFITKPSNICQNDICQNLNINDDDIGRGYCSSKCVVEHSKHLFNYFLMHRKLQNENFNNCNNNRDLSEKQKIEPFVNDNNNSSNNYRLTETDLFQSDDEDLPNTETFDLPDNFRVDDYREPVHLQSPIKSLNTINKPQNSEYLPNESIEIIDDELEIIEPREPFFSIAHKVIFSQENTRNIENNNKNTRIITNEKKNSQIDSFVRNNNNTKKTIRKSSPDVIFVSLNKKRAKTAEQTENFEIIVID